MKIPTIGVTTGANPDGPEDGLRPYAAYREAVELAGGRPVYLDPRPLSPADLGEVVNGIDGLLLTGGKDVHPRYYLGGEETASAGMERLMAEFGVESDEARDEYEIPLARLALDRRIPVFGICRGLQLLNVVLGGTLIKDIRTGMRHQAHRNPQTGAAGESAKHPVEIESNSLLSGILGQSLKFVNSRHHQGITLAEKSERLRAVAFAPDGLIEAVESRDHPWVLAVQWHPERKQDRYVYEPCRALFRAFTEKCAG